MAPRARLPLLVLAALAAALALSAAPAAALVGFQSKDHKVGCVIGKGGVRCDVKTPKWDPPPAPPSCNLDWGHGVEVGRRGPASYVCAGDTTLNPRHRVLRPGKKVVRGRFRCKAVNEHQIKCVNKRNREGFSVSRFEVHLRGSAN